HELNRRNRTFDAGRGVVTFDRPVLSVGNLSVGGTGKTPTVAWLVEKLRDAQFDTCVAMRGYAARDGLSDEAELYRSSFDNLPVVAQANRTEGLLDLFATERGQAVNVVVLDDGFQHRRVARNFDLVLIDARSSPWEDRLLPAGWLRESPAALGRAHGVLLTHAHDAGHVRALESKVRELMPHGIIASATHTWRGLQVLEAGELRAEPVAWLRNRRVGVCCAIGSPGGFVSMVREACGRELAATMVLADHDPYSSATVSKLRASCESCEVLVVTQKDWSKLRRLPTTFWPCAVAVPELQLQFCQGEEALAAAMIGAAQDGQDAPSE
ncbi:MAG: tetraacyldisaccharide 4'-kinase, partial [Planctomycetota bacterium]|nr:tetraacyldisaccharide 4'-kinase [Planctomycetota bacterium]